MSNTVILRSIVGLLVIVALAVTVWPAVAHADTLDVEALHDVPAPVEVRAQGWDSSCTELYSVDMLWTNNDNNYGTETITIPSTTAILRFTFTNDSYSSGGPDNDRNFILDYWERDASRTQGEAFDRTGGTDSTYPGCGKITWEGRAVTDCGNQNDWVEYGSATEVTCTPADCSDGLDNDGDGDTDCADTDCTGVGSCALGDVDHYKVYSLDPEVVSIPNVQLEDQFGAGPVDLTNLGKLGVPVSKAHAPNPPAPLPGGLIRPFEHLTWYEFFEAQPPRFARLKNQFTSENKGAIWSVTDGHFLLVPAIKDGLGPIELGQHWKCYDADLHVAQSQGRTLPDVIVNLLDQFHLEPDVDVGTGRYLCNPVDKNFEGPPPLPEQHLACYTIIQPPLGQFHSLEDQFGGHPVFVENPELLCLPSQKFYSAGPDFDSDGVADALDNCSEDVNSGQDDTDIDDCGNICDTDYDNTGTAGFPAFGQFVAAFTGNDEEKCHVEPIPGCFVGFPDFGVFVARFGMPPGPSGTTAGTPACP